MIGSLLRTVAGSGGRARLSILIFHRVLADKDPLFPEIPDAAEFRATMLWVRQWFTVLPLADAVEQLAAGELPPAALAITFDDGYADNATIAAPLLSELGLSATFFVASGFIGGGRMWNDTVIEALRSSDDFVDLSPAGLGIVDLSTTAARRAAIDRALQALKPLHPDERARRVDAIAAAVAAPLPDNLMMDAGQLRSLVDRGMTIGAHTVTHPILNALDEAAAIREVADSRDQLVSIIDRKVELFAYPNGVPGTDYSAAHVAIVRRLGFRAAVTTAWGVATSQSDRWQLPRFTPWDRTPLRFGMRMIGNLRRTQPAVTA